MARPKRAAKRPRAVPAVAATPPAAAQERARQNVSERAAVASCAAIAVATAVLYLRTAATDLVFGDSPELTGAAITFGVAHPPGYPVWTALAHVFTLLPLGTLPFRVSLFSVAAAVACVILVYLTAYRLSRSAIAASVAAATLALVPAVWTWSVVPEVFPLNDLLAAALVYLLLDWHLERRPRSFIAAAFVGGIGMANQQTIALTGPAVLYLMWQHRRLFRDGGLFLRGAGAVAAGLLPYVALPIVAARHPAWSWGDLSSPGEVLAHVLRSAYGTASLVSEARFQGGSAAERLLSFARSFTLAEIVLVALGVALLYRRDRVFFWFLTLAALVSGPLFVIYSNTNLNVAVLQAVIERFFLLAHVILAPAAALGVVLLGELAATRTGRRRERSVRGAVAGIALVAAVLVAAASFDRIDERDRHAARTFADDILSAVRPSAILLAGGDAVVGPVGYRMTIEGARPDITYVQLPLLRADWYVRQLKREHPDLVLRYPRFDQAPGTMRGLVEPNGAERFDIIGTLLDDSLASTYGLYRRGLVEQLRPRETVVDLAALSAENDAALRSYRIPAFEAVADRPWERLVLGDYGLVAYDVGRIYERSKRNADARVWYARALAIDPDLVEARSALQALPP